MTSAHPGLKRQAQFVEVDTASVILRRLVVENLRFVQKISGGWMALIATIRDGHFVTRVERVTPTMHCVITYWLIRTLQGLILTVTKQTLKVSMLCKPEQAILFLFLGWVVISS